MIGSPSQAPRSDIDPDALAIVPHASPSPKKVEAGKTPATDLAKNILVEISPSSHLPNTPLQKDRVKSLSEKSDLGDFFTSINPDDDCFSLTEEELEELEELEDEDGLDLPDDDSQDEECPAENIGSKFKYDSFIDSQNIKIQALHKGFKEWLDLFKEYANYPHIFLKASEYLLSDNKDNFVNVFRLVAPEEAADLEDFLELCDTIFKWADCGIPFLTNMIHGIGIHHFNRQAEGIKQSAVQFAQENEDLPNGAYSSVGGILRNHYVVDQFQTGKIEKEWNQVKRKGGLKFVRLVSKIVAVGLAYIGTLGLKTANRVTKSGYELIKSGVEIWDVNDINEKQREWLFHLQPFFLVNIEPENPTLEEVDRLLAERVDRDKLIKDVKDFLLSLERSTSLEEVEQVFKQINMPFVLPPQISDFKQMLKNHRLIRDLFQCYYYHSGQRVPISPSKLYDAIGKKEEEHSRKVDTFLSVIVEHIDQCEKDNLSFAEIQTHFAKLHIDISSINIPESDLPIPPTNKLEWNECIQNDQFVTAMASKWVDFQEGTAQMVMQAVRQALLSKHKVERKFLLFKAVEIGVRLISTAIQLSMCNPQVKLTAFNTIMEILLTDIAKWGFPSLGAFYLGSPLYPGMKFKIEAIFMQVAKHFFAIAYKPNEYSLEAYELMLKLRWTKLVMLYYTLQFILQKGLLWTNIRLVDNCIKGMDSKSLAEDTRYDDLSDQYELFSVTYRKEVKDLENSLWELQAKDANLIINPQSQKSSANTGPSDPIKDLAAALIESDIDCYPSLVIEFFENHLNFKLSNDTKADFEEHVQDFFVKSEDKFISAYSSNRFDYLKV